MAKKQFKIKKGSRSSRLPAKSLLLSLFSFSEVRSVRLAVLREGSAFLGDDGAHPMVDDFK